MPRYDPFRGRWVWFASGTGGVAAFNHRLRAVIPSGLVAFSERSIYFSEASRSTSSASPTLSRQESQ